MQGGFPFLPAGCHMELDRVASEIVLRSIRDAIPTRWPAKVDELRALHAARPGDVSLSEFLRDTGLELEDVYAGNRTWSELRDVAGLDVAPPGPHETALRRGIARLLHIDDPQRTQTYRRWLSSQKPPDVASLSDLEARLARMLAASIADTSIPRDLPLQAALDLVWAHPQPLRELAELLDIGSAVASPAAARARRRAAAGPRPLHPHRDPCRCRRRQEHPNAAMARGRVRREEPSAPICWPSPSTRPAANSPRRPGTATTRSVPT